MDANLPKIMHAVVLTGHGGFDKMEYRTDVLVPSPKKNEVLIRIAAAGVNNTDINTRIGWYSKSVTSDTNKGGEKGLTEAKDDDGIMFNLISKITAALVFVSLALFGSANAKTLKFETHFSAAQPSGEVATQ